MENIYDESGTVIGAVELHQIQQAQHEPKPNTAPIRPKFKFGDRVINGYADKDNPQREAYFIRYVRVEGRVNNGAWAEVTDGNGKVWQQAYDAMELAAMLPAPNLGLRDAAQTFVEKLDRCHEHYRYVAVWTEAHRILGPYDGPTYEHELNTLRQALAIPSAIVEGGM